MRVILKSLHISIYFGIVHLSSYDRQLRPEVQNKHETLHAGSSVRFFVIRTTVPLVRWARVAVCGGHPRADPVLNTPRTKSPPRLAVCKAFKKDRPVL